MNQHTHNGISGWIGVDLDGTLAHYDGIWKGESVIGEPIPLMLGRVEAWLAAGVIVKIFTARVAGHGIKDLRGNVVDAITPIQDWCEKHLGRVLEITNVKDYGMIALYDDRAYRVEMNTGCIIK